METLSPLGPVFHAGTLSGNPLATAAGLAALDQLVPDVYIELAGAGPPPRRPAARRVRRGRASRPGSRSSARCVGMVCGDVPEPVDFDGARRTDEAAYGAFFQAMLAEGVAMAPGAYEAIFVGLGHDDAVLDEIGERAASRRRRRPPSTARRRRPPEPHPDAHCRRRRGTGALTFRRGRQ